MISGGKNTHDKDTRVDKRFLCERSCTSEEKKILLIPFEVRSVCACPMSNFSVER